MPFIGFILIGMGLFSVGGVLFMVMREHDEPEEWYIPPSANAQTPVSAASMTSPSPSADAAARQQEDSGE